MKHYMQFEITPEFLKSQGFSPTFEKRFWAKVNKNGPIPKHRPWLGHCWEWQGSGRKTLRYGSIAARWDKVKWHVVMISAHIASWILHHRRSVPDGLCVCHKCDNGFCVRPSHLFTDTHTGNMHDMISKGRHVAHKGEECGAAKLTWEKVEAIRARYVPRRGMLTELASEFGVTRHMIARIVHNQNWIR